MTDVCRTDMPYPELPYAELPYAELPYAELPYAELHCHSNFSFLDGASHPDELVAEAVRLGLGALALTDHDGLYGVVRFAEAARAVGLPTVFGAELTLNRTVEPLGTPDPGAGTDESHLVVLARDPRGYALLSRAISEAQLRGVKGAPQVSLEDLAVLGGAGALPGDRDHWLVLTGCRKGAVPAALVDRGPVVAGYELNRLVDAFGRDNVVIELWDHGEPLDSARNDALVELAVRAGVDPVATTNAHYAAPSRRRLATALAAVRARRSLDELDGWLPAAAGAHLRSGGEQARRFARYPGVVARAAELGHACAFDLALVAPRLPPYPCPGGIDEMTYLRHLTEQGATERYGPRWAERVPGAWAQIDHELAVIDQLGFVGYFLIVWDLVQFCRDRDIWCQGRGSAANSAVCFSLGVTRVDAVSLGLLFERFLSPERDGPPDIDLDIESDRREEVIQYVYASYGRHDAAQVANVITYRVRSAVRDMAGALGHPPVQRDAWARQVDRRTALTDPDSLVETDIPADVAALANEVCGFPRHLGVHSGGMVLCDRPVIEVCPVEWARAEGRTVLQWDKDDCAAVGLVKFDLLGLGMLSALHYAVDFIRDHHGVLVDLAMIDQEDEVYDLLCEADSIGIFQVESRAQMATLPRLQPRTFYDLVVQVALIRPGPIQGGSVHPYIRRRNGAEPVTYLHPLLKNALAKTLGVPLFQEQLMQMAIDVAGFTPAEADRLRQAMGSKRSRERMEALRVRLYAGMAERGVTGDIADAIYAKLAAFADFGFPESHSASFAYLVYSSAWIKYHYPTAFYAGLLKAQPMGFYSPHSLVQDARRHGVEVRIPDVNVSEVDATLEDSFKFGALHPALRMGLASVRSVGRHLAELIVAERKNGGPFLDILDMRRRVPSLERKTLESLATAGAFGDQLDRRRALWTAGAVAQAGPDQLAGIVTGVEAPQLPGMSDAELARADLWATGVAPDGHPTQFIRGDLDAKGVVTSSGLRELPDRCRVTVAGVVTHRQRPATAGGTTFINLEDETGMVNVICSKGCWARYRHIARGSPALLVRGRLEVADGAVNVVAERIEVLAVPVTVTSRDFR